MTPGGSLIAQGEAFTTQQAVSESEIIGQVTSLYDLQRSQTGDKTAGMQAELAWLQSRPQSIEQQQAIVDLKQAMEQLTQSTNDLNATNQDLLSPYYTQDPCGHRTSDFARRVWRVAVTSTYRAATRPIDNMIASIPVASGERIYVDPMTGRRGTGGGSLTINISSPVLINGNANKDEVRAHHVPEQSELSEAIKRGDVVTIPAYRLPAYIEKGSQFGPSFRNVIHEEKRQRTTAWQWTKCRATGNLSYGLQNSADPLGDFNAILALWRGHFGSLYPFRFRDWGDYIASNEVFGTGTGSADGVSIVEYL